MLDFDVTEELSGDIYELGQLGVNGQDSENVESKVY
jgi:hypothetical protein